jgi:DNA-binding CsgD family transcriptional regulator/tetratricopeptide (TPR) repeat protein
VVDLLERRAFVGRERELASLLALFDEVAAGSGRTAVVAGEAGIGKSRLIAQLERVTSERARSETGACLPIGTGGLPYGPFVEILRRIVTAAGPQALPALLGPGRSVLIRLLPEVATRDAEVAAAGDDGAGTDGNGLDPTAQGRLFEIVLGVFRRLARERPLLLAIEDIQWADRSTRELLAFLVRALRDDPVLLVLTVRSDDELGRATLDLLAELERDEGVERIDLVPFGRAEVADQAGALLDEAPEPDVIDRLFERSDGNPFFVEELVLSGAAGSEDLPAVVRDVVAARLAGLSTQTREALRAATVAGRTIDEELLADVLFVQPRAVAAALREAIGAGVLERDSVDGDGSGRPPRFRHELLRQAVAAELFPGERASLHEACAEALVRRVADGRVPVEPSDLARHWDEAGRPARALRPMVEAARAAESVFAWPEALEAWLRARALHDQVPDGADIAGIDLATLDGEAADCAVLAGEYPTAIQLGRAAIDALEPGADPTLAGTLHNRLRWYLWEAGDRRGAAAAVDAALALIPSEPPSQARAAALAQRAGILLFAGRYRESEADARQAMVIAKAVGAPGEEALAAGVLGWDLAALGDVEAGLRQFREGQAIAASIGSPEGISLAAINLVSLLDRVGRSQEQLETALREYRTSERLGVGRTYGSLILGYAAKAQLVLGLWDELDRTTLDAIRSGASDRGELWLSINRARLLAARGRLVEAAALIERCRVLERRLGGTEFHGSLLLAEAELAIWQGDLETTRRAGVAGVELAGTAGPPDSSLAWLAILVIRAEADALERAAGGARETADRAAAIRRAEVVERAVRAAIGERPELGAGERAEAIGELLLAERSRLDDRPDPALWEAVVAGWSTLARPYAAAYARFRQAEAAIATRGSRDAAAALLAAARSGAEALGAIPLRELIDRLARAARLSIDGPAATTNLDDPYGFTPREREVLALVAEGRTNHQIAEALFITRKTASVHVSNIMAKLGAANRGEAAALAHRLGLLPSGHP